MLNDQASTYAILRYCFEIPDTTYRRAMNLLLPCMDQIEHPKLIKLLNSYAGITKVGIVMDEEFVETIEVPACNTIFLEEGSPRGYSIMIEDVEED
jgi:hypothetical protein